MNLLHLKKAASQAAHGAVCAAWLCAAMGAQAQTVYRIVGVDGRVTFSDKPPVSAEQGKVAATGVGGAAAASAASLPFELRQVATRYPVVLYSAPDCGPCSAGRNMLTNRGIPFSERSVTTSDDVAALKRLSGESSLPFLSIGGQRIKGYTDLEWTQYLDAAGYPKTSVLPSGYRQAAATPLVSMDKPAARVEEKAEARPEPSTPAQAPANPAGIQF
jgi:glutaredoxin